MRNLIIMLVVSIVMYGSKVSGIDIGHKGPLTLVLPVSARVVGMGSAFVANPDDVSAIYWNPAGLAMINNMEVALNYTKYVVDTSYFSLMGGKEFEFGTLGVSLFSFSYGDMVNYVEGEEVASFSSSDFSVSAGYSKQLMNTIYIGGNVKIFHESLTADYSGTGFGVDIGGVYKDVGDISGFNLGLVMQNIGIGPKVGTQNVKFPFSLKLGLAYNLHYIKPFAANIQDINFYMDLIPVSELKKFRANIGTEIWFRRIAKNFDVAIRSGLELPPNEGLGFISSLRFGASIKVEQFQVDYALLPGDLLFNTSHYFGIKYLFGGGRKKVQYSYYGGSYNRTSSEIANEIESLKAAKAEAIQNEDYVKAAEVKKKISKLEIQLEKAKEREKMEQESSSMSSSEIEKKIEELKAAKAEAIQNEDYVKAAEVKKKISKLEIQLEKAKEREKMEQESSSVNPAEIEKQIEELKAAKAEAIKNEDYGRAAELKKKITELESQLEKAKKSGVNSDAIRKQIEELKAAKAEAIKNEDYGRAAELKKKINELESKLK